MNHFSKNSRKLKLFYENVLNYWKKLKYATKNWLIFRNTCIVLHSIYELYFVAENYSEKRIFIYLLWILKSFGIKKDFEPPEIHIPFVILFFNGSQFNYLDISGAILTLSLSILILNSQCVEGARDVRVLQLTPIILAKLYWK